MTKNFVSLKYVVEKIYRDTGINKELPLDDCVSWIYEALMFIGAFGQYEVKLVELTVANHKTELPCDFIDMIDISHHGLPLYYAGKSLINNFFCHDCKISTFDNTTISGINKEYFQFQGNQTLATSFRDGHVCITYTALPTDDEGFPMIADNVSYLQACSSYVIKMLDWQLWRKGQTTDAIMKSSASDWDWFCAQARGSMNLPNLAELENLKNVLQRLIPQQNQYGRFFQQDREQKRIQ